jgi:hypothetical protein
MKRPLAAAKFAGRPVRRHPHLDVPRFSEPDTESR